MMLRRLAALVLATAVVVHAGTSLAQDRLSVVASFSILGDIVSEIGGERVDVTTLVGPGADAHTFVPTPADAREVANADIVAVNGLGLEGWIDRLIEASGFAGPVVVASTGIVPLAADEGDEPEHGAFDPHAWQDVGNVVVYAGNIAAALTAADPDGAAYYAANLAAYDAELAAVEAEIVAEVATVPPDKRIVVTSHDAFRYFEATYGIAFIAPQGIDADAAPAARDVAALIAQIRSQGIRAVFVETITDPRLIEQIARETGATVGGTLYSDTLSGPDGPAATYLALMRYNTRTIVAALNG